MLRPGARAQLRVTAADKDKNGRPDVSAELEVLFPFFGSKTFKTPVHNLPTGQLTELVKSAGSKLPGRGAEISGHAAHLIQLALDRGNECEVRLTLGDQSGDHNPDVQLEVEGHLQGLATVLLDTHPQEVPVAVVLAGASAFAAGLPPPANAGASGAIALVRVAMGLAF